MPTHRIGTHRPNALTSADPIGTRLVREARPEMHEQSALMQFLSIMVQPDNIPIVGMMVLLFFFTYLAFREARKNDQLIAEGKRDEVLKEMQQ
jgi:hypothetical protein